MSKVPKLMITKINRKKTLLKKYQTSRVGDIKAKIKSREYSHTNKAENFGRAITPNNTQSLWILVKIAHETNITALPKQMYDKEVPVQAS
jgi:hypothetical protein